MEDKLMAVGFQPQVWGDKIFSPITSAIQQERQRQHQKGLADAQNALAQQRIDEQARANKVREQHQATLLDMTKQQFQSKQDTRDYQRREIGKKAAHDKHLIDVQRAKDELSGKWYIPNSNEGWQKLNPLSYFINEQEMKNQISTNPYKPSIPLNKDIEPSVIMQATGRFLGPTGTYEGVDSYEILNQLGIK
jgi:hypothetical protein